MPDKRPTIASLYKKYVGKTAMYYMLDRYGSNAKREATGKGPGSLKEKAIWVRVKVIDVRTQWGRVDALITPLDGGGSVWCRIDAEDTKHSKLELIPDKE